MKKFLIILFVWQTLFYSMFWLMCLFDVNNNAKILWKPLIITFYLVSVLVTFLIPMFKELRNSTH